MGLAVRGFPILLGGVIATLFSITLASAGPPVSLIEPQWQAVTNAQGVSWMIDQQSNLRVNNGASLVMAIGTLTNNGGQFSPSRTQMTPDGGEYVFEGALNSDPNGNGPMLQIVRHIKVDRKSSTLRFVESVQNTAATPVQVNLTAGNFSLRSQIQSVVGGPSGTTVPAPTGQSPMIRPGRRYSPYIMPANNGTTRLALPARDCGLAIRSPGIGVPGMVLYAPESKNVKPAIDVQNSALFQISFAMTVPAQSTVSVVWGLADRTLPATLDAHEMKNQLKVFRDRDWLADLPENLTRTIVNYRRFNAGDNAPLGPLLQPVLELAAQYEVERGKSDVLVQDEQSHISGTVAGSDVTIETSLGKAVTRLDEVALLAGGAGVERPMRVYLRNGEILAGRVEAKDLVIKDQAGVEERLLPEKINLLFLHAAAGDGKPATEALAMAETHDGQRLLVSDTEAQFQAATPWGSLDVALGEIVGLSVRSEPQPVYRLTLKDGSDLSVLLQGEPPPLKTLRFGSIRPATGAWQLSSLKAPVAADESDPFEPTEPAAPAAPHCRLMGETVLAGTIETPKVNLATGGGVLALSASQIQTAQRSGDPQADGPFDIQLIDGRHLSGQLTNRTFSIRFHGKVWDVPAQHLIAISSGKSAKTAESPAGQVSTGSDKADLGKGEDAQPAQSTKHPLDPARTPPPKSATTQPAHGNPPTKIDDDDPFVPPDQPAAKPAPVQPAAPVSSGADPFGP